MLLLKSPLVKVIRRPQILLSALRELDTMVEMDALKEDMVDQVISYCVNGSRFSQEEEKSPRRRVLHFCNYGDPGTGKTYASKIVAKVYYGLGFMEQARERKENAEDTSTGKWKFVAAKLETLQEEVAKLRKNYLLLKEKHAVRKLGKTASPTEEGWRYLETNLSLTEETLTTLSRVVEFTPNREQFTSTEDDDPNVAEEVYCVVCGRNELVAKFMGQTAGQTYDFLMANRGKTIIIEEAYVLWTGERDIMGFEALVEIHRFMDECPEEAVVSFNGYERPLLETIFKIQPGLQGRLNKFYQMKGYTASGLANIFTKQVSELRLKLSTQVPELISFFTEHGSHFPAYGRDTLRLARQLETTYLAKTFASFALTDGPITPLLEITAELFGLAFAKYLTSCIGSTVRWHDE